MATECQLPFSDEDSKMLDEARERGILGLSPETYEEMMPDVERTSHERDIECLRENIENAKNELRGKSEELTHLEKLDLEVVPSNEQCEEMWRIGKEELGLKDGVITNFPTIYGTEGVENISQLTRKAMDNLYHSKMRRELWDVTAFDGIMFIDAKTSKEKGISEAGSVFKAEIIKGKPELPRILHLILDEKGELRLKEAEKREEIPKDKTMHWGLAHEIFHRNAHFPSESYPIGGVAVEKEIGLIGEIIRDRSEEWYKVCRVQIDKGAVSEYSLKLLFTEGVNYTKDDLPDNSDFAAEHFAAWETDSPKLCPEMKEFFDKYLSR